MNKQEKIIECLKDYPVFNTEETADKEHKPQIVGLKTILKSPEFLESTAQLPIAVGMDDEGKSVVADLAKMPHLLIAGATGQGKSVFLNTLIVSLLATKKVEELQLLLIDPKMVEFSQYRNLANSYLLKVEGIEDSIITNTDEAKSVLNALCAEMDLRYSLLKDAGVRVIKDYNDGIGEKLPYVVVVIDEFADLIMTLGKDIETPILRLAQKARAVGIHVVLATQRPSKNVITRAIKANFLARIAFRVGQRVDSKTILDQEGANDLLGRGNMLFSHKDCITRLQGAFIDSSEIDSVVKSISKRGNELSSNFVIKSDEMKDNLKSPQPHVHDPLFDQAVKLLASQEFASSSLLQRTFGIGYKRAGKLIDELESAGIVGHIQGAKPREILINLDGTSKLELHSHNVGESVDTESNLNSDQTFETFCTEDENSKEFSISKLFVNSSASYTSLIIYGKSGSGKTHLAHAIGNKSKINNPVAKVVYLTGSQFSNQVADATLRYSLKQFFSFYQSLDMLIIVDCQALLSKEASQSRLLQVIDVLYKKKAKVVFVFDSHPSRLTEFDSRLLSRIVSGITIELKQPSRSLRFRILEQQNQRLNGGLPSEYLLHIAESETSIFEMLGLFNTILAYKKVSDGEFDNSLIIQIIGDKLNEDSEHICHNVDRWKEFIFEAISVCPEAESWIKQLYLKSFKDGKLIIEAPSQFFVQQLEKRFIKSITPILKAFWGEDVRIFYTCPNKERQ
ncbi:MAG: FtsK/SpoIIIE domain-containing protein [Muribaculum sp.]|nr:FtsK/SpoIIIE domain-containing protein [Muribaculum sp.]